MNTKKKVCFEFVIQQDIFVFKKTTWRKKNNRSIKIKKKFRISKFKKTKINNVKKKEKEM